jgi:hypothetical protein
MGFGDHWQRARDAAHTAIGSLGANDRATFVLFSRNAEENMRATTDRARLNAAVDNAKVDADSTRYGPALKLAESILSRSQARRREAVLISDFQRSGWTARRTCISATAIRDAGVRRLSHVEQHRHPVRDLRARPFSGRNV